MTTLTTLQLADAMAADAERRWLYGHPYRDEIARDRGFIGIRTVRRLGRRFDAAARAPRGRLAV
jgi:hypothetical protein